MKNTLVTYSKAYRLFRKDNSPRFFAKVMGIALKIRIGYITATPNTLNKKCTKAIVMAAIFPVANEAIIAVVVVPILAPKVMGKASSTVKTPAPIKGTRSDVVMELLWTKIVKKSPAMIPITPWRLIILSKIVSVFCIINDFMIFTIKYKEKKSISTDSARIKL